MCALGGRGGVEGGGEKRGYRGYLECGTLDFFRVFEERPGMCLFAEERGRRRLFQKFFLGSVVAFYLSLAKAAA